MCEHMNFSAQINVIRMEDDKEKYKINGYMAEITIKCVDCNKPFQFLGLEAGIDTQGARVSIDGLEVNIAICPENSKPSPLQRMVFNINKFDG